MCNTVAVFDSDAALGEAEVAEHGERIAQAKCKMCGGGYCMVNLHIYDGQVTNITPNPQWPGSMSGCIKMQNDGAAAIEYHYSPDRLNFPLKRAGERGENKWERISWDDALSECAEKLNAIKAKYGAEAVIGAGGTEHYPDYVWAKSRFLNGFGTPNSVGNEQICHGPYTKSCEVTLGWNASASIAPGSIDCLLVNSNLRESGGPGAAMLRELKNSGCRIISLNPEFNYTSIWADDFLQIRPGSDGAFYMAMIHVLIEEDIYDHNFVETWTYGFEEIKEAVKEWTPEKASQVTWISAAKIRETARIFANAPRKTVYTVEAMEGQDNNGFRNLRACWIFQALAGAIDNGLFCCGPYFPERMVDDWEMEMTHLLPESQSKKQIGKDYLMGYEGWELMGPKQLEFYKTRPYGFWLNQVHGPTLWRQIISEKPYPLKAIIMTGCSALTKFSNTKLVLEAIKKLDLIIVADFFHNPNTQMADYVFPMSDWMERPCLDSSMAQNLGVLSGSVAALEPMYERRSDYDFYRGLAIACGQGEYWPQETLSDAYDYRLSRRGMTHKQYCEEIMSDAVPFEPHKYEQLNPETGYAYGFGTPTGRVELHSTYLEQMGFDPTIRYEEPSLSPFSTPEYAKEYPLILITGRRSQPYYHSEFRGNKTLRALRPDPIVLINPETAQLSEPAITDGDWVWIETHIARVKMRAKLTSAVHPDVISAEHNWWFPEEDPKAPSLYGCFKSSINAVLDDDPAKCGEEIGSYVSKNAMCKVYKA